MKENKLYCPYCGYQHYHEYGDRYECEECGNIFNEDDIKREEIRHKMSAILFDQFAVEENPMPLEVPIGEWDEENAGLGLSSLDLPWTTGVFEFQDGTIWFNLDCSEEPMNFDDICTRDLEDILSVMQQSLA